MSTPIESLINENQQLKPSYADKLETVDKTHLDKQAGIQDYIPEINVKEPTPKPTPVHAHSFQPAFHFQQPVQVPSSFSMMKQFPSEPKKSNTSFETIQNEVIYIAIICTLVYSPGFQNVLSFNFKTIYSEKSLVATIFNTLIVVILYVLLKKVKIKVN